MFGYRMWSPAITLDGEPILESVVAPVLWDNVIMEAQEISTSLIDYEPHWGIHSFKEPEYLFETFDYKENGGFIIGAIAPFGLTYFHERGYRSAKAQIVALCDYITCETCETKAATKFWRFSNPFAEVSSKSAFFAFCDFHSSSRFIPSDIKELIDVNDFLEALSKRYHCDIVNLTQFKNMEDNDGYRRN